MTTKTSSNILIAAIALTLVIILVAFLKPNETEAPVPTNGNGEPIVDDEPTVPNTAINFSGLFPETWSGFERAERNVQTLGAGQRMQFYVIEDPTDENVVYFSTSAFNSSAQENTVSIYRYRTDDFTFERLFRNTYGEGAFPGMAEHVIPDLHPVGYDSGALVILAQDTDDSPGPCAEPILLPDSPTGGQIIRRLVTMRIDNPYGGFEPYTLPEEIRTEAETRANACLQNL